MQRRLFWKILFSFWLTFICIVEGVWLVFSLYDIPRQRPGEIRFVRSVAEVRLGAASTALLLGGENGLLSLLETWPEDVRARLAYERLPLGPSGGVALPSPGVKAVDQAETDGSDDREYPVYSRTLRLSDSRGFRLRYNVADLLYKRKPGLFNIPPELLLLGVLGGLLFSALLAWYLTAPVRRLRMGFGQLTQGDLGVRLKPFMGRRRDEIADLARDFDIMAERMQFLVESREQLLYDVSHELRSPLARQHMAIGLARQNPQRTQPLLDRIEQESSRMDDLVGELLMLSRVESGDCVFDEYFDLQGLVHVVVNNSRFEAAEEGVEIELQMATPDELAEISTVRGDAELVRRALENVVRNAVRHSPRGSKVQVVVLVNDGENRCSIQVSDRGPGVPRESLERIFESFVRLKNSKSHGTGLGLAIAKRAIAVHGGSIQAVNREQGGLCITIVLPLEPPV